MGGNDYVPERIGDIGLWQCRILVILGFAAALGAWQILSLSFLLPEVKHTCLPNETNVDNQNLDPRLVWNNTVTLSQDYNISDDQCTIYTQNGQMNCTAWSYDSVGNVVQHFNLVCDRDYLVSLSKAMYMGGMMLGILSSGVLSDLYGRKKMMIITAIIFTIFSCCAAASDSIWTFIGLRMVVAGSGIALFTTCYVYAMEIIGGYWSTFIGIGFQIPWAIAYMILPGLAYALPYWVELQLAISVPCILFLVVILIPDLIPESPKWLLTQGRDKEAEEILDKAAKMNQVPIKINRNFSHKVSVDIDAEEVKDWSYSEIFKSPHTVVCTLVMFYLWFTNSFVYYGLILNSGSLMPGNIYINTLIAGILELVAYILTILAFHYWGRRYPQCITMVFGGVALCLTQINANYDKDLPQDEDKDETVKLVFGQLGKFAITASFAMVYLYAAELFPTVLRNSGMANSSFFARVGSVLAPFAGRELGRVDERIPVYLFAVLSIFAGLLTLVLPETKDTVLRATIKDGEKFIANKNDTFRKCLPKPAE